MTCPTCAHTMQQIIKSQPAFWCPRCGTIKLRECSQSVEIVAPTFLKTVVGTFSRIECRPRAGDDPGPLCGVLWGKVAHFFGLGSTSASALCVALGFEPSQQVPEDLSDDECDEDREDDEADGSDS